MAETGDAERLVVLLEARVRDFEKNMQKAEGTATRSYSKMRKESASATKQMEADMVRSTNRVNQALAVTSTKIGALGKTMASGFVGGLVAGGIAGLVTQINDVARSIASVGDQARMAGLDVKSFQELAYVAKLNRIEVGALADGMKELNLRADEFIVTGGGSAAEAFKRLGFSAEELNDKLKDPSALFTEIIGKLAELDRAAAIRIADEIFGGQGGERFVQLIDQGADGIRQAIDEANALGIVMSEDLIDKADEVNRKFEAIATTVEVSLKARIVEAVSALQEFIDKFNAVQNQQIGTLEARMKELGLRRVQIENSLIQSPGPARGDTRKQELEKIAAEEAAILEEYRRRKIIGGPGEPIAPAAVKPPTTPTVPGSGAPGAEREAEQLARRLDALRRSLMTEEQLEMDSHLKRLEEINKFYESGAIAKTEQDALIEAAHEQHSERMTQIAKDQAEKEAAIRDQLVSNVASIFGSLSSLAETFGEENLGIAKAFGVAEAVINTAQGITKALAIEGPLGFVSAASIAAAGAAQIATIMSAKPGSSSAPTVSGGGGQTSTAAAAQQSSGQAVTLNIHGGKGAMVSGEEVVKSFTEYLRTQGKEVKITYIGA